MAKWTEPYTEWNATRDIDGNYVGDYFNYTDYNRIKNNIQYLYEYSRIYYEKYYAIYDMGDDKAITDWLYQDDINKIERNIILINSNTVNFDPPNFTGTETKMINYQTLNEIEQLTLDIYNSFEELHNDLRMFTWNFGSRGGIY